MDKYDREKYELISYNNEQYCIKIENIVNDYINEQTLFFNNLPEAYTRAKEEAAKGKKITLLEIKYEFKP